MRKLKLAVAVVKSMARTMWLNRKRGLRIVWKAGRAARAQTVDAWSPLVAIVAREPVWVPSLRIQVEQGQPLWLSPLRAKVFVDQGRFVADPTLGSVAPEPPTEMVILEDLGSAYPGLGNSAFDWKRVG